MSERDRDDVELVEATGAEIESGGEPPVVARLVVEIRSDGSRTIARGALEDTELGQRAVIEARGTTPAQLAWSLAKTIASAPALARQIGRAMLTEGAPESAPRRRGPLGRLARRVGKRILGE